jgi:CheY-like chemotaxis protein
MKSDCTFLLIEDNIIDQLVTTRLLKNELGDLNITIVNNGEEGLKWLHEYEITLSDSLIILLDIKMPEMDGFEFLSHYEGFSENLKQTTEIFMLSSTIDVNDIKKATENSYVKRLFSKPLPVQQFKEMIVE